MGPRTVGITAADLQRPTRILRRGRTVVFAPHPNDEILACAGVVYRVSRWARGLEVVVVTKGDDRPPACAVSACRELVQRCWIAGRPLRAGGLILPPSGPDGGARVVVCILDQLDHPVPGVEVRCGEAAARTNPLGWALLELTEPRDRVAVDVEAGPSLEVARRLDSDDFIRYVNQRRKESVRALATLGVAREQIHFLDCPAAVRGDTGEDARVSAAGAETEEAMRVILQRAAPHHIFLPHPADADPDHRWTAEVVRRAVDELSVRCTLHHYIVHAEEGEARWPEAGVAGGMPENRYRPDVGMRPPRGMPAPDESLPLPARMVSPRRNLKRRVVEMYLSQVGADLGGFMLSFVKQDEIFWSEEA